MRIICDFDPSNATDRRALRALLDAYDEGDRTSDPMPADGSDEALPATSKEAKSDVPKERCEYYSVENGRLQGTYDNRSYYKATVEGDRRCYSFNDDGPHKEAISNRATLITPFCDIVDELPDADKILTTEPGEATLDPDTDYLSIDKRAKVKLIKQ